MTSPWCTTAWQGIGGKPTKDRDEGTEAAVLPSLGEHIRCNLSIDFLKGAPLSKFAPFATNHSKHCVIDMSTRHLSNVLRSLVVISLVIRELSNSFGGMLISTILASFDAYGR